MADKLTEFLNCSKVYAIKEQLEYEKEIDFDDFKAEKDCVQENILTTYKVAEKETNIALDSSSISENEDEIKSPVTDNSPTSLLKNVKSLLNDDKSEENIQLKAQIS